MRNDESQVEREIQRFKAAIRTSTSTLQVVRRHVTYGDCFTMDSDRYYSLKASVAAHFDVHPASVLVVGSAKLGFSIAPRKRYKHFSDDSDIDVAIISTDLFEYFWEAALAYSRAGGLWEGADSFKSHLFQGWIRPDMLPRSNTFEPRRNWWEYFRKLTQSREFGSYKIAGGLYKSWAHLEAYQCNAVQSCIESVEL